MVDHVILTVPPLPDPPDLLAGQAIEGEFYRTKRGYLVQALRPVIKGDEKRPVIQDLRTRQKFEVTPEHYLWNVPFKEAEELKKVHKICDVIKKEPLELISVKTEKPYVEKAKSERKKSAGGLCRSHIIDECLKKKMTTEQIIAEVMKQIPDDEPKKIKMNISVRQSHMRNK